MPCMDTTQIDELLRSIEQVDPAEAPDIADALAEALEAMLDAGEGSAPCADAASTPNSFAGAWRPAEPRRSGPSKRLGS